jgi:hypothetical protein
VEQNAWDALVVEAGGNIHHASIWAKYVPADQPQSRPRYFTLLDKHGEARGAALGFYEQSGRSLLRHLTGRLWFDATPLVLADDDDRLRQFLVLLETHARCAGAVALCVGSFGSRDAGALLEELGFDTMRRFEFEFDLRRSEEELWNGFDFKRRNKVRKAIKAGITVLDLPGLEGLSRLRALQADASKRIVARGGPDISHPPDRGSEALSVLLEAGVGRVLAAVLDGEVVCAAFLTNFNGLVYQMISGSSSKGLEMQAPTLLLWEATKIYRQQGAARFSLGGCAAEAVEDNSPEHGVYVYKKSLTGACIPCTSGRKVFRKKAQQLIARLRSALNRYGR